eukprot:4796515-Pleurochrysis_carterae.AAC.1
MLASCELVVASTAALSGLSRTKRGKRRERPLLKLAASAPARNTGESEMDVARTCDRAMRAREGVGAMADNCGWVSAVYTVTGEEKVF